MPRIAKAPALIAVLLAGSMAAGMADAQVGGLPSGGGMGGGMGGGGMGGGGGGHHGHRGQSQDGDKPAQPDKGPKPQADKPVNQIEIVGVVKALDPATDRITIAYEPVEALGWPAGSMPFVAGKSAMLQTVAVGQKVRFKLDSQQISEIKPFVAQAAPGGATDPSAPPPNHPAP